MMHVYLIHGPNDVEIQTERMRLIDQLLPVDQRDENLTEFASSGNRALTLSNLLPDLLAEMGTVSFFPGARRVAIVHQLSDFWSSAKDSTAKPVAKSKKGAGKPLDVTERLIKYLETDFESAENAVIFTVHENPDKRIVVDGRKKIVQWIKEHGKVRSFEAARPSAWVLGDAILDKNLDEALAQFRQSYKKGQNDQAMAIFSTIQRQVRLLLQAKIFAIAGPRKGDAFVADELFPADAKSNLLKMHGFPRKKIVDASRYFNVAQLTEAMFDLYEINRYLIPASGDIYVADVGLLMERLLIKLCSRVSLTEVS